MNENDYELALIELFQSLVGKKYCYECRLKECDCFKSKDFEEI